MEEEELEEARGALALHKMSASGMILWGMRLEEQQYVVCLSYMMPYLVCY